MNFKIKSLVLTIQNYLKKSIGGFAILVLVGQMLWWGGAPALAAPPIATSIDRISTQVSGKVEELKGSAKQSIGKTSAELEDKATDAKSEVKDEVRDPKIAADSSKDRIANTAERINAKVKNLLND